MNKLIEFFIKQPVFGNLLTAFIIIGGIASFYMIRREVFPNVQFDIITVTTIFPGASAEEAEKLITNPLEQDFKEIDGVKRMTSVSAEGRSFISIQLDPDESDEIDKVKTDVQDIVDRFTDLPSGADKPVVTEVESKLVPIIEVTVAGNLSDMAIRENAKRLETILEDLRDVARVDIVGLRDLEIRVEPDMQKLARYQLSLDDLVSSLKSQNISIPGGTLEPIAGQKGGREKLVRTVGEFQTPEDVENTVIRANDLAQGIRIKDVATVRYDLEKASLLHRTNGKPSVSLTVLKKRKADAIRLVETTKEKIKESMSLLDKGIEIDYVNDNSYYISRRLGILSGNLAMGLALVLGILALILPFRLALIVSLGIPFAFFGTMIYFVATGVTLNMISVMGLIIVVGMLVDDAIVVTDNAYRLMEEGMTPQEAALEGTKQVWAPIAGSVLTTVFAFAPMLTMSGIMGKFIWVLPLGVISALLISLFEAYFITPVHFAAWIKPHKKRRHEESTSKLQKILATTEHWWDERVMPKYMRYLEVALKHRYRVMAGMGGFFVISLIVAGTMMKMVLFPSDGIDIFFIRAQTPSGSSLEQTKQAVQPVEEVLAKLSKDELMSFVTTVGLQRQDAFDPNTKRGNEYAQVAVYLTPEADRDRDANTIIEEIRQKIGKLAGVEHLSFDRVNPGPPVGKPISVGIRGKDYEVILPAMNALKEEIAKIPGASDIAESYIPGKNEISLKVNPNEAAAASLSVGQIGTTVRAAFEGLIATTIRKLDEEIDIRVILPAKDRATADTLEDIKIPNRFGNLVPLSRIADFKPGESVSVFEHEDNTRQVRVTSALDTDKTSAVEATRILQKEVTPRLQQAHKDVTFFFGGGEAEDTAESMKSLMRAFGVAAMAIFLILVLEFKQLLQPMLILITIPLGIVSVIWTFFLHGKPFSFMGILGIVALAGVIVNNAIVFMEFVNEKRLAGSDRFKSIMEAGKMRLRPIFLTTSTTVVGLLPTAYGIGGYDPFVVPIALSLGWGLAFGSVLTAFIFPAAVAITDDFQGWLKRRSQKRKKLQNGLTDATA